MAIKFSQFTEKVDSANIDGLVGYFGNQNIRISPSDMISTLSLNASNITSGTLSDARLSSNVALKDIDNNFSVGQTINGNLNVDNNTLFVDASADKAGIGTNTPDHKLHVLSNEQCPALFQSGVVGGGIALMDSTTTDDESVGIGALGDALCLRSGGAAAGNARLLANGNFGINELNPDEKLVVDGNAKVTGDLIVDTNTLFVDASTNRVGIGTSSPDSTLTLNGSLNSRINLRSSDVRYGTIFSDAGIMAISTITSIPLIFGIDDTERMRIDSSGNVGIGTSSLTSAGGYNTLSINGSSGGQVAFQTGGTLEGYIYNTSSLLDIGTVSGNSITISAGGSERMRIDSSGVLQIRGDFAGTGQNPTMQFYNTDASLGPNQILGDLDWYQSDASGSGVGVVAKIRGINESSFQGEAGLSFFTGTTSGLTERMRITSAGDVLIGTQGVTDGSTYFGSTFRADSNSRRSLRMATSVTTSQDLIEFFNPAGRAGYIQINASSTSYVTSSDYRLKENVVEMTGALDRVDALKPSRFNFIADPETTVDGFLAHEVQDIVPEAITGEKDAMRIEEYEISPAIPAEYDEEGNVIKEAVEAVKGTKEVPVYQGIDQAKLVPLLVGAIKEQQAIIKDLTERIGKLENNAN